MGREFRLKYDKVIDRVYEINRKIEELETRNKKNG